MSPSNGNGDGDGLCKQCENGDWECAERPCEAGGGTGPQYERIGRIWVPIGNGQEAALEIFGRAVSLIPGTPLPRHRVEVYIRPQVRCGPPIGLERLTALPENARERWFRMKWQMERWEREYLAWAEQQEPK